MTPRIARREDAGAIAGIEQRCGGHWTEAMLAGSLAQATTRAWVEERDGAVVGHLITSVVAGTAEIVLVATDPALRRQGVGRALLATAEAAWRREGVEEAFLEVRADNEPAIALYRSRGWEDAGVRRGYYRDGTDARLMRWRPL